MLSQHSAYAIVGEFLQKYFNMAGFNFTATSGDGCFHIGRKPSVLVNGAEFTLTECVTGIWRNETGGLVNKEGSNSIRFKTSLSDDIDDAININRLLSRTKVVYNQHGEATLHHEFKQYAELRHFLESTIGRDETDSTKLKGTAKEVGNRVLSEFFNGKKLRVTELANVFFKDSKNGVERLVAPIDPVIEISIVE
jgi:hypothetical protein